MDGQLLLYSIPQHHLSEVVQSPNNAILRLSNLSHIDSKILKKGIDDLCTSNASKSCY